MANKVKIRRLPIKDNIIEAWFPKAIYNREKIETEVNKLTQRYPDKEFQVVLPYENFKSGSWFKSRETVSLFSLTDHYDESELPQGADPESFDMFIVYIRPPPPQAGGCRPRGDNGLNDCLYYCLRDAYGYRSKLPESIKTPELLKTLLGLQRNDPVHVNLISRLEKIIKTTAINVTGDAFYISKEKSQRQITLILANSHYSIAKNPKRKNLTGWFSESKKPLVYKEDGVNNIVEFYDGKDFSTGTVQALTNLKAHRWSGEHCFIRPEKKKDGEIETLEEAFIRFNKQASALQEITKKIGLELNLYKAGGSYKIAALWLFEKLSQGVIHNQPLDPLESKWISDAMKGGLIWAENDWKGYGEQYDITSMYPYLMSKMQWPIQKGEFRTVKDFEYNNRGKIFSYYGLFKAKIEKQDNVNKLFRYNSSGIYTHLDLKRARDLGLTITLDSLSPNALIYGAKAKIQGQVMFGAYDDFLLKVKNTNSPAASPAKKILNTLWGALCQRKKTYTDIGKGTKYTAEKPFEPSEGHIIETIIPTGENYWTVHCSNPAEIFEGEYPRVAPFLLAHGRKTISEIIQPYADQLKRVHTDGFILEKKDSRTISVVEDASKILGALKFEKEGHCTVKNAMQVIWY